MKTSVWTDANGDFRWRACATNGKIVADSGESYKTEYDAYRGMVLTCAALTAYFASRACAALLRRAVAAAAMIVLAIVVIVSAGCSKIPGSVAKLVDINDGKILGAVPVEKLAPGLRQIGVPEYMIDQIAEHARLAQMRGLLRPTDVLIVTYRLRSTHQAIDPKDIEMAWQVVGVRDINLPEPADIGIPIRVTAPGVSIDATATSVPPAAPPAVPHPPASSGGEGRLLDGPDTGSVSQ